jgi:hypothetical protein
MTTNTVECTVAVRALDTGTYPQQTALRTSGDAVVVTWRQYAEREYAERARRTAAELAALGVRRSDTVALMLTNRPQFRWVDVAATEELGSTTFDVYSVFSQSFPRKRSSTRCVTPTAPSPSHRTGIRRDTPAGQPGLSAADAHRVGQRRREHAVVR